MTSYNRIHRNVIHLCQTNVLFYDTRIKCNEILSHNMYMVKKILLKEKYRIYIYQEVI